ILLQRREWHIGLDQLVRIEGVDAARSPWRLLTQQREEPSAPLQQTVTQGRDDVPAIDKFFDETELGSGLVHCWYQFLSRQPFIGAGIEQKADEAFEL